MDYREDYIDLRQQRDFGQMLSATFGIVRREFLPLLKALVVLAGPFILAGLVVSVFVQIAAIETAQAMLSLPQDDPMAIFKTAMGATGAGFGLTILATVIGMASNFAIAWTGYEYVRLYMERGEGNISVGDVARAIGNDFGVLLGTSFLSSIMIVIGLIFCILPGIYLLVPMSFFVVGRIMQRGISLGDSFSQAFELTKERFWVSLLTMALVGIILLAVGYALSIPLNNYTEEIQYVGVEAFDKMHALLLALLNGFTSLLGVLPAIAAVVIYVGAREYHRADSLYDEVEGMDMEQDDDGYRSPGADSNYGYGNDGNDDSDDDARRQSSSSGDDSSEHDSSDDDADRWKGPGRSGNDDDDRTS